MSHFFLDLESIFFNILFLSRLIDSRMLKGAKFSRHTDPKMFKMVLQKVYPDLTYTSGKYMSNGDVKGKNIPQLMKSLARDITKSKPPQKFKDYPAYITNIADVGKNSRVYREFSPIITELSGFKKVTVTRKVTKETVKTIDKNVVIKTTKTKLGLLDGKIQPVEIEEIEETIPERITIRTTRTQEDRIEIENLDGTIENIELPNHPVMRMFPEFAKKQIALYGPSKYVLEKLNCLVDNKVEKIEEEWFSYKKCQKKLTEINSTIRGKIVKLSKILRELLDECGDDEYVSTSIYDFMSPEIQGNFTFQEKIYIQLQYLANLMKEYQTSYRIIHHDDPVLDYCYNQYSQYSNLCIFEDMNANSIPFAVNNI